MDSKENLARLATNWNVGRTLTAVLFKSVSKAAAKTLVFSLALAVFTMSMLSQTDFEHTN